MAFLALSSRLSQFFPVSRPKTRRLWMQASSWAFSSADLGDILLLLLGRHESQYQPEHAGIGSEGREAVVWLAIGIGRAAPLLAG